MAYALRYYDTYYSRRNHSWRFELYEDGYSGASEQVTLGPDRVRFSRESQGDSINRAIKGSECTVQLYATTTLQYYPLFDVTPLKYLVKVLKDSLLYWQGYVSGETYKEPYSNGGFYVTMKAYDGVQFLKNTKYLDAASNKYTGSASLLTMLSRAMGILTPLLPFVSMADLYETRMDSAYTDEPLSQVYIDHERLYAAFPDCTCEDIVNIVVQPFGQMRQYLGAWYLVPVRSMSSYIYGKRTWDLSTLTMTASEATVDLSIDFTSTEADDSTRLCLIPDPTLEVIPPLHTFTVRTDNGVNENAFESNSPLKLAWTDPYELIDQHMVEWGYNQIVLRPQTVAQTYRAYFRLPIVAQEKEFNIGFTLKYIPLITLTSSGSFKYYFIIRDVYGDTWHLKTDGTWEKTNAWSFEEIEMTYDSNTYAAVEEEIDITAANIPASGTLELCIMPEFYKQTRPPYAGNYTVYLKNFTLTIEDTGDPIEDVNECEPLGIEDEELDLKVCDVAIDLEHPNNLIFSTVYFTLSDGSYTKAWYRKPSIISKNLRQWLADDYEAIRGKKSIMLLSGEHSGYIPWCSVVKDNLDQLVNYLPNAITEENTGEDSVNVELIQLGNYLRFKGDGGILLENGLTIDLEDDSGILLLEEEGTEEIDPTPMFTKIIDSSTEIVSATVHNDTIMYCKRNDSKVYYINADAEATFLDIQVSTIRQLYGCTTGNELLVILTNDSRIFTYNSLNGLIEINTTGYSGDDGITHAFALNENTVCFIHYYSLYSVVSGDINNLGMFGYQNDSVVGSPIAKEIYQGVALVWMGQRLVFLAYMDGLDITFESLSLPSREPDAIGVGAWYEVGIYPYLFLIQSARTMKIYNEFNGFVVDMGTSWKGEGFATCKVGNYTLFSWKEKFCSFQLAGVTWSGGAVYLYNSTTATWRYLGLFPVEGRPGATEDNIGVDIVATSTKAYRINKGNIWKLNDENI